MLKPFRPNAVGPVSRACLAPGLATTSAGLDFNAVPRAGPQP